jgi:hypothetical protein
LIEALASIDAYQARYLGSVWVAEPDAK